MDYHSFVPIQKGNVRILRHRKSSIELRTSCPEMFCKKDVLKNFAKFAGKHFCQSIFFNKVEACNLIKKETLAQVFSCEFFETFKNSLIVEHLWWFYLKTDLLKTENFLFPLLQNLSSRLDFLFWWHDFYPRHPTPLRRTFMPFPQYVPQLNKLLHIMGYYRLYMTRWFV